MTVQLAEVLHDDDEYWPTAPPRLVLGVYLQLIESTLERADKRNYQTAVKQLKAARRAAGAAGLPEEFDEHLAALREQHRRRPTLIAMLDKANLSWGKSQLETAASNSCV